ncbi:MAG: 30S ribosomal protein S21 [Verrucomicrobiales bacterium]|nr:30S ribosomal protein S21 [Verrucomicrobiales bacterium]
MTDVEVTKGESVDRALKRLKNKLEAEGIMDEMRRLRSFETPVQRYRRKQRTAAKKSRMKFRANLQVFRRGNKSNEEEAQVEAAEPATSAEATAVKNTES